MELTPIKFELHRLHFLKLQSMPLQRPVSIGNLLLHSLKDINLCICLGGKIVKYGSNLCSVLYRGCKLHGRVCMMCKKGPRREKRFS